MAENQKEKKEISIKKVVLWYALIYSIGSIIVYILTGTGHALGIFLIGLFMTKLLIVVTYFLKKKQEVLAHDNSIHPEPAVVCDATAAGLQSSKDEIPIW